jgi:hypothetical protein
VHFFKTTTRKTSRGRSQGPRRLSLENLEGRQMMSATPLATACLHHASGPVVSHVTPRPALIVYTPSGGNPLGGMKTQIDIAIIILGGGQPSGGGQATCTDDPQGGHLYVPTVGDPEFPPGTAQDTPPTWQYHP